MVLPRTILSDEITRKIKNKNTVAFITYIPPMNQITLK